MKLLLEKIYQDLSSYRSVIEDKNLNDNRRSRRGIVSFNNTFFKRAKEVLGERASEIYGEQSCDLINRSYNDVEQKLEYCKDSGYVNITFIDNDKDEELTTQEKANAIVLNILNELKNGNISMKDILILVRKNKEGSDIAGVLNENGYKVVSNDSLFLSSSPKVKLVINLLKFITDTRNYLARAEILYNYSIIKNEPKEPDKLFSDLSSSDNFSFFNQLPEEFLKAKEEGSNEFRFNPLLNNLSLYELIENLIRIFKLNDSPDAYLVRFQDAVIEYVQDNTSDITGFLDWWEENQWSYSIIVPAQEDAVRIMTIHKAKGLQSPVIIIPYANWGIDIDGTKELIWVTSDKKPFDRSAFLVKGVNGLKQTYFEKDFLEEASLTNIDNLNLLYVAFTRASDRLYAIVPEKGDRKFRIDKLIKSVIDSDEELKHKYNPETKVFEAGDKNIHKPDIKESNVKSRMMQNYISSDWYKRIIIRPKHKSLKLVKQKDFSDKTSRGNIIHEIMSHIITPGDVDYAINYVQNEGMITEDIKDKLKEEVEGIINIEGAKDWFSGNWEVKSEAEILETGKKPLRPDRVMIKDGNAVIVDYKTGIEKEEEHRKQLEKYAAALLKAGYSSVEKYILYAADKKVVKY
jgi:ATP-dependent exoDNAse (exonuclease V) beta subunit